MRSHKTRLLLSLLALAFVIVTVPFFRFAQAATITVVNLDGPGEGFNDPTPVAPVGGNPATTLGAQRLNAFQAAADLWGTLLNSSVTIRVGANFDPLSCSTTSGTLGSAGPENVIRDFTGAPVANTWFPLALANSLAGVDLDPSGDDIGATFNSNVGTAGCLSASGWYYGLDANPPSNRIDLVAVVLHELGHGLGFSTLVNLATGAKALGFNDTYMRFLENHSTGKLYPNMTNAERVAASMDTGDLHWVGPNVVAASGFLTSGGDPVSGHVEMFAPNPQQPGSSVSHFSNALFPNELMEPAYTGPNHDVALTAELFKDIGWNLNIIFADSMESGSNGWLATGTWGQTTTTAHSPTHSWTDSPGGNYANNQFTAIFSPVINLAGQSSPLLTFWHRYAFGSGDAGFVMVYNGTYNVIGAFVGNNVSWHQDALSLSAFAGQSVIVVFVFASDASGVADGWYIDDVGVGP